MLARGFGCDIVVVWRGYGGGPLAAGRHGALVRTVGRRGNAVSSSAGGYEFGSSLPTETLRRPSVGRGVHDGDASACNNWIRAASQMARTTTRDNSTTERLSPRLPTRTRPNVVRGTTLRDAAIAIVREAQRMKLPVVENELRDSYGYTWTLQGTLATRTAQKRRNANRRATARARRRAVARV